MRDYGNIIVVIDFNKFKGRLIQLNKDKDYIIEGSSIEYYDEFSYHDHSKKAKSPLFYKVETFRKEREYRICIINQGTDDDKPFILNIGSIRDICEVYSFKEFYTKHRIQENQGHYTLISYLQEPYMNAGPFQVSQQCPSCRKYSQVLSSSRNGAIVAGFICENCGLEFYWDYSDYHGLK